MGGMLVGKAKVAVIFTRITQGCAAIAEGGGNTEMLGNIALHRARSRRWQGYNHNEKRG